MRAYAVLAGIMALTMLWVGCAALSPAYRKGSIERQAKKIVQSDTFREELHAIQEEIGAVTDSKIEAAGRRAVADWMAENWEAIAAVVGASGATWLHGRRSATKGKAT